MAAPEARRARAALLALAWALALFQWLGAFHAAAHVPGSPSRNGAVLADPASAGLPGSPFALHDDGSPDCRLYDQLAHGDALWAANPVPQHASPAHFAVASPAVSPRATSGAPFLARAPPPRA